MSQSCYYTYQFVYSLSLLLLKYYIFCVFCYLIVFIIKQGNGGRNSKEQNKKAQIQNQANKY